MTISFLTIILSGTIPFSSSVAEELELAAKNGDSTSAGVSDPRAPFAKPMLLITSVFHVACASYLYTWYTSTWQSVFLLAVVGHSFVAALGLWCSLFGGSSSSSGGSGEGMDKRVSGFPFKNAQTEKKRKSKLHIG